MSVLKQNLDQMLAFNSAIMRAAIINSDGELLARTEDQNLFLVDRDELRRFAAHFIFPASIRNGVYLELILYRRVRIQNNLMRGSKHGAEFFAAKNGSIIVIAVCEGNSDQVNQTRQMVENLSIVLGTARFFP